jgi:hypothetical protein
LFERGFAEAGDGRGLGPGQGENWQILHGAHTVGVGCRYCYIRSTPDVGARPAGDKSRR